MPSAVTNATRDAVSNVVDAIGTTRRISGTISVVGPHGTALLADPSLPFTATGWRCMNRRARQGRAASCGRPIHPAIGSRSSFASSRALTNVDGGSSALSRRIPASSPAPSWRPGFASRVCLLTRTLIRCRSVGLIVAAFAVVHGMFLADVDREERHVRGAQAALLAVSARGGRVDVVAAVAPPGLALTVVMLTCQSLARVSVGRATLPYHTFTTLPFSFVALACFVTELCHGASRRTWVIVAASAAVAILGPAILWLMNGALCPPSQARTASFPLIGLRQGEQPVTVTQRVGAAAVVVALNVAAIVWTWPTRDRRPCAELPSSLPTAAVTPLLASCSRRGSSWMKRSGAEPTPWEPLELHRLAADARAPRTLGLLRERRNRRPHSPLPMDPLVGRALHAGR